MTIDEQKKFNRMSADLAEAERQLVSVRGTLAWTHDALVGVLAERNALADEVARATKERLAQPAPQLAQRNRFIPLKPAR